MPIAAPHPCAEPGCSALVPRGMQRCATHRTVAHQRDRERRGSARERGYDAQWEKYRRAFLAEHPLCVLCQANGLVVAATVVDHVKPHKGDRQFFWEPSNHRAVCKPCHDKRVDEGDFGRSA